jgi:hypothetical protein
MIVFLWECFRAIIFTKGADDGSWLSFTGPAVQYITAGIIADGNLGSFVIRNVAATEAVNLYKNVSCQDEVVNVSIGSCQIMHAQRHRK